MWLSNSLLHPQSISQWYLLYTVLCFPLSILMVLIVPLRLRIKPLIPFIFFYILSTTVVVFGLLISFVLVFILRFQKPPQRKTKIAETVTYPDYQRSPVTEVVAYGESGGLKIITDSSYPNSIRESMLVAINQYETTSTNKINSAALNDDIDEIRLYAYSLIEKQERQHHILINNFSENLHKTSDLKVAAYYKKQIAEVLWDLVYKYLVTNENLIVTLNKISAYATEALEQIPDDPQLPLLLTKVALRESNLKDAKKWLEKAIDNQSPDYKIISLLAEIKFMEKNYDQIKDVFTNYHSKGIIGLQSVKTFWLAYD